MRYKVKIYFRSGRKLERVLTSHWIDHEKLFAMVDVDRNRYTIPIDAIEYVEFDSNLDAMIREKNKTTS